MPRKRNAQIASQGPTLTWPGRRWQIGRTSAQPPPTRVVEERVLRQLEHDVAGLPAGAGDHPEQVVDQLVVGEIEGGDVDADLEEEAVQEVVKILRAELEK